MSFFLWRPSNVPKTFPNYYRSTEYWNQHTTLQPPSTPKHLSRFQNIDPVPRIKKTQAEIQRTLKTGTVPPHQRRWLRINPTKQFYFENLTGPQSEAFVPPGTYPVFETVGPGPWKNQYHYCKAAVPTPTTKKSYSCIQFNPDHTIKEPDHFWE